MDSGGKRRWEHGAVERIQKAKRAKKVKRFTRHKKRQSLVNQLEKDALPSVIVAPELGIPGVTAEENEQKLLARAPVSKNRRQPKPKKRGRENSAAEADIKPDEESKQNARESSPPQGEQVPDSQVSVKKDSAKAGPSEKRSETPENEITLGKPSGGRSKGEANFGQKRANMPFQKEIKKREAERMEREKERQRWQEETEAYKKRIEESRQTRKKEVRLSQMLFGMVPVLFTDTAHPRSCARRRNSRRSSAK